MDRVGSTPIVALACRGCCCGTDKHPDVDHDLHLRALEATGVPVEITGCLGPCRWSNVVVTIDDDGHETWFGQVLRDRDVAGIADWLRDPLRHERPDHLRRTPIATRRARAALAVRFWRERQRATLWRPERRETSPDR